MAFPARSRTLPDLHRLCLTRRTRVRHSLSLSSWRRPGAPRAWCPTQPGRRSWVTAACRAATATVTRGWSGCGARLPAVLCRAGRRRPAAVIAGARAAVHASLIPGVALNRSRNNSCRVRYTADSECGGRRQVSPLFSRASSPAQRDRAPVGYRETSAPARRAGIAAKDKPRVLWTWQLSAARSRYGTPPSDNRRSHHDARQRNTDPHDPAIPEHVVADPATSCIITSIGRPSRPGQSRRDG
jgi:hypothetical protein